MKKRAIRYTRISRKDQSNWSLPGQGKDIERYAQDNGIEIIASFVDEGQSAKNFDRASWRELEAFVKKHHREIDMLLVVAYDRFSRNVSEALNMIAKLENKYNILIISVTQPIPMHPDNPYYFKFRTDMLVNAEMELRVIRDRARTGFWRGAKEGRFLRPAPIGYINGKDKREKPLLYLDEQGAKYVKEIFRLFLTGAPIKSIEEALKEKGMKVQSNSRIQRILQNPIYAGFIKVPEYYGEPEHLVKGLHPAIIEETTWWKVQALMNKPEKTHTSINDALPLRNVLKCKCGRVMTGAPSKGKYAYYNYYWCVDHRKQNYSANKIHAQLDQLIKELELPDHYIDYLQNSAKKYMAEAMNDDKMNIEIYTKELLSVEKKLDSLEQKYLFEGLEKDVYHKYKLPLEQERAALNEKIFISKTA